MPKVIVAVREVGRQKIDYSLVFDLPEIPRVGEYISVTRPDVAPWTEDFVVRKVWWQLNYPNSDGYRENDDERGTVADILVLCDQAIGPQSADRWRDGLERRRESGTEVEEFDVPGLGIRQEHVKK